MVDIDVQDFDYLAGGVEQAQAEAQAAAANTSSLVGVVGSTSQIIGFNSGGNPQAKSVAGDSNGAGLAFSGNTLQATLAQDLQTTGTPEFAALKIDSTGTLIQAVISASATLDFPNTAAQTSSDLTITVTGAAVGDPVFLAIPAAPDANSCFTAWVSGANTVTVRFNNYSAGAIDPASGSYRACVFKF